MTSLLVPSTAVAPIVTAALEEALRAAAEEVERCGCADVASFKDALDHFELIRAAFAATGFGSHCDLDADEHRDALALALTARVELERHLLIEGDRTAVSKLLALKSYMAEASIAWPEVRAKGR